MTRIITVCSILLVLLATPGLALNNQGFQKKNPFPKSCQHVFSTVATAACLWFGSSSSCASADIPQSSVVLDTAVGTITNAYYDTSGGVYFDPHEYVRQFRKYYQQQSPSPPEALLWLTNRLDTYSTYISPAELQQSNSFGFLGLGIVVEAPSPGETTTRTIHKGQNSHISNKLPVITAVYPNSPAERAGLVVGDRLIQVGTKDNFLLYPLETTRRLIQHYASAENYVGYIHLQVAKPVVDERGTFFGYRPMTVRVPSTWTAESATAGPVQYHVLDPSSLLLAADHHDKVGYLRLSRFSKTATTQFLRAVEQLDDTTSALIIDLRNNYGGIFQESMLSAATLLRDPHAVLCWTMNNRGGLVPHEVEEFVVDERYPGYLLSTNNNKDVVRQQVQREHAGGLLWFASSNSNNNIDWSPPSAYASLHELSVTRGLHIRGTSTVSGNSKPIVLLVNEGTASSAEVFAAALRDNGRCILVGTKTYAKGVIQHVFPLPDGGALKLTVAEYLTPHLQHVTHVGAANYNERGEWVGGGLQPDVVCESRQGIPRNVGADFCVGVALDVLAGREL